MKTGQNQKTLGLRDNYYGRLRKHLPNDSPGTRLEEGMKNKNLHHQQHKDTVESMNQERKIQFMNLIIT